MYVTRYPVAVLLVNNSSCDISAYQENNETAQAEQWQNIFSRGSEGQTSQLGQNSLVMYIIGLYLAVQNRKFYQAWEQLGDPLTRQLLERGGNQVEALLLHRPAKCPVKTIQGGLCLYIDTYSPQIF